jgi:hypothetical protein
MVRAEYKKGFANDFYIFIDEDSNDFLELKLIYNKK